MASGADLVGVAEGPSVLAAGDLGEEPAGSLDRLIFDPQPGPAGAGQRHDHPAGDRQVALLARLVAPAAFFMLGLGDELDRRYRTRPQPLCILGYPVGLYQRQGGDAVVVHVPLGTGSTQVAGSPILLFDQPLDAFFNHLPVLALLVVAFASAVKGKQGKPGARHVVVGSAAILAQVPAAILGLGAGEIGQRLVDGGFSFVRTSELAHHLDIAEGSLSKRVEHAQLALDHLFPGGRLGGDVRLVEIMVCLEALDLGPGQGDLRLIDSLAGLVR